MGKYGILKLKILDEIIEILNSMRSQEDIDADSPMPGEIWRDTPLNRKVYILERIYIHKMTAWRVLIGGNNRFAIDIRYRSELETKLHEAFDTISSNLSYYITNIIEILDK